MSLLSNVLNQKPVSDEEMQVARQIAEESVQSRRQEMPMDEANDQDETNNPDN